MVPLAICNVRFGSEADATVPAQHVAHSAKADVGAVIGFQQLWF